MVGVPALITETFSCSYPKHHRARTHKPEVNKHISEESIAQALASAAPAAPSRAYEGTAEEHARRIIDVVLADNPIGRRAA